MQRVRGVGGVFLRCTGDRAALLEWYAKNLGIEADPAWGGLVFAGEPAARDGLVWSFFEADTDYFGARSNAVMINYKVDDLDAMLAQLRAAGADVDDKIEASDFGRFGWCTDPEGNRIELWQPPDSPPAQ